jgi:hypothetical protein
MLVIGCYATEVHPLGVRLAAGRASIADISNPAADPVGSRRRSVDGGTRFDWGITPRIDPNAETLSYATGMSNKTHDRW